MSDKIITYGGTVLLGPDPTSAGERCAVFHLTEHNVGFGKDNAAALEQLASELHSMADAIVAHARRYRRG